MYTYIYTYICIYTYTCTHTYLCICIWLPPRSLIIRGRCSLCLADGHAPHPVWVALESGELLSGLQRPLLHCVIFGASENGILVSTQSEGVGPWPKTYFVHEYIHIHIGAYIHIYINKYGHIHAYIYARIYVYVHIYTYMCIQPPSPIINNHEDLQPPRRQWPCSTRRCMNMYTYIYIHIHMHIHIHVHVHTYLCICTDSLPDH